MSDHTTAPAETSQISEAEQEKLAYEQMRKKRVESALQALQAVVETHRIGFDPIVTITPSGVRTVIQVSVDGTPTGATIKQ